MRTHRSANVSMATMYLSAITRTRPDDKQAQEKVTKSHAGPGRLAPLCLFRYIPPSKRCHQKVLSASGANFEVQIFVLCINSKYAALNGGNSSEMARPRYGPSNTIVIKLGMKTLYISLESSSSHRSKGHLLSFTRQHINHSYPRFLAWLRPSSSYGNMDTKSFL